MSDDPTTWGLQTGQWVTPIPAEILSRMKKDELGTIVANLDLDADAAVGQFNGIVAAQLGAAWEALGALEASRSRDGAEEGMLDENGKLTGTPRGAASATKTVCSVSLAAGTTLTTSHLASVLGHPEITFRPVISDTAGYTATTTGVHQLVFQCTQTGPVELANNTLTVITTPLSGWTAINNPIDATLGLNRATDDEFRLAQLQDLFATGSSTARALEADLNYNPATKTGVPGVVSAMVLQNDTDFVDFNGVAPKTIECIVDGDGTESNVAIAAAIWEGKGFTCGTSGTDAEYYLDADGETHYVRFSKVIKRPVYMTFAITRGDGYIGDTALKQAIVTESRKRCAAGDTVNYVWTRALPMDYSGVVDVPSATIGFSAPPVGTANLTLGLREVATFDVARITLT